MRAMLILHSGVWSALAHGLNRHQCLWSVDKKYCTGTDSIFSLSDSSVFWGAIICSFPKFPVFRRHLSFLWVGLVQNKGFPPPTSIHCLQKGHLIVAMGQQARKGLFSLLHATCTAKRSCKVCNFPCVFNIRFPGSVLFLFFFPPTSFHLLFPWRMKCLFHSSCRLNRFWGWWMVRISYPSFSKHRPCLVLDISLARDWQSVSGSWKGGWQCPAEMLFQFVDEISGREKVLRTSVQSLVLRLTEAWMLTLSACSCFPRAPREKRIHMWNLLLLMTVFQGVM